MGNRDAIPFPKTARLGSSEIFLCNNPEDAKKYLSYAFAEANDVIAMFPHPKDMCLLQDEALTSQLTEFLSQNKEHRLKVLFRNSAELLEPVAKIIMEMHREFPKQCVPNVAAVEDGSLLYGFTVVDRNRMYKVSDSAGDFFSTNASQAQNLFNKFEGRPGVFAKHRS